MSTSLTATYNKDSERYHRYIIDADEDKAIVGTVYIKKGEEIPKELTIRLTMKESRSTV